MFSLFKVGKKVVECYISGKQLLLTVSSHAETPFSLFLSLSPCNYCTIQNSDEKYQRERGKIKAVKATPFPLPPVIPTQWSKIPLLQQLISEGN